MKTETVNIDGRKVETKRLRKTDTVDIGGLIRSGYRHILRDVISTKRHRDGSVSGNTVFLKLNKKRQIVDMAGLPIAIKA